MKKTKKSMPPRIKILLALSSLLLLAGIFISNGYDLLSLSTALVSSHSYSISAPASTNYLSNAFTFSAGLNGVTGNSNGKVGSLSLVISNLPSNINSCAAYSSVLNWKTTTGKVSGGKVKVLAIGSKEPIGLTNPGIVNIRCYSLSQAPTTDSTIKIKGELTTNKNNDIYSLGEKSINIKPYSK